MKSLYYNLSDYLPGYILCLVILLLITSPLLAKNRGRLANPEIRRMKVAALKNQAAKKQKHAWRLAKKHGWKPKWKKGNTVYELLAIEENRVYVYKTFNTNSRISIAADLIESVIPYNLSGSGVTVGVWDGGNIRTTHQELTGRVNILESSSVESHATHVGGTIAASGVNSSAKGMAPSAVLYEF